MNIQQNSSSIQTILQSIGKGKNSSSPGPSRTQALQQQLQFLSLSYKNAQQKLLSLQKQAYFESVHNQKQRSIIQILKYIINGNLDDESILAYLIEMQESYIDRDQPSTDQTQQKDKDKKQSKHQIKNELQQIKQIVYKRKMDNKKSQSVKNITIADLKKQLRRVNQIKRQLMEDLDRTLNQKGSLQSALEDSKNQCNLVQERNRVVENQMRELRIRESKVVEENGFILRKLQDKEKQISAYSEMMGKIKQKMRKLLKIQQQEKQDQPFDILNYLGRLQQKLQKYRKLSMQLSKKVQKQSIHNEYINSLKAFVPQQGVKVCQQIEQKLNMEISPDNNISTQRCLIKQLQSVSRLQKKKYSQLQHCQEEVWRLKTKILRDGNTSNWGKSTRTVQSSSGNRDIFKQNELSRVVRADKQNLQPNQQQINQIQDRKDQNMVAQFVVVEQEY